MYTLYVILCSDNSLYTGIAKNLERRFSDHERGEGSKYVRSRLPFRCIYTEELRSKSEALKREREIKRLRRAKKIELLNLELK